MITVTVYLKSGNCISLPVDDEYAERVKEFTNTVNTFLARRVEDPEDAGKIIAYFPPNQNLILCLEDISAILTDNGCKTDDERVAKFGGSKL